MSKILHLLVLTALLLALAAIGFGQDSALVLLRPSGADKGACTTGVEPSMVTVKDFKINGKTDIRLAGGSPNPSPSTAISRTAFDRMRKVKLKDLTEIEVRDGLLYAATGEGAKTLAIPDVEPARNSSLQLAQYTAMPFEGDAQEGRTKQKKVIPLTTIWRIFILGRTMSADEALFRHAQEEASVSQWAFYTSKVTSYRLKEAADGMASATNGCLDRAMKRFQDGEYGAINEARELAQKVVSMSGGTGDAATRLADIRRQEQSVRSAIDQGTALGKQQKWDDALNAWKAVTQYRKDPTLSDFAAAYEQALQGSHDTHVTLAKAALANRGPSPEAAYQEAKKEYEVALQRKPGSAEAAKGRRDAMIELALMEADRSRKAKEPGKAHDTLEAIAKEVGEDPRITAVLKEANCEYGLQLFDESRSLATVLVPAPAAPRPAPPQKKTPPAPQGKSSPPKQPASQASAPATAPTFKVRAIRTAIERKPFVDARAKLTLAMGLCPSDDKLKLLADINVALADYHVAQAKTAIAKKLHATALLNLQAAQFYQAERPDLEELMTQVREPVHQKAQIQAGVVISSTSNECAQIAQQIAAGVESALVGSGGANIQLISREQADQKLRSIRAGSGGTGGNYAIVSGQLGACTISVSQQQRQVASKFQTPNQNYNNLQQAVQDYDRQVDACKQQNPQTERTACAGLRSQRQGVQDRLYREQPVNLTDYTYNEQPITTTGQMQLTLQIDDSILRGTRPAGSASGMLNDTCVSRGGYREDDVAYNASIQNVTCPGVDRASKLLEMAEQVQAQAQTQAAAAIRSVAKSYLELAKRATDQDLALENYILFALLSSEKAGPDYQQAVTAIHARDNDLKPETALR